MHLLQILQIRNDPEHLKPTLFLPAATLLCAKGLGSVFISHLTSHSWFQNSMAQPYLLTHLFPQICCQMEAVAVTGEAEPTGGWDTPQTEHWALPLNHASAIYTCFSSEGGRACHSNLARHPSAAQDRLHRLWSPP